MSTQRDWLGKARELAVLGVGLALTAAGLLSKPREPEVISIGVGLLIGTSAVGSSEENKRMRND